MNWGIGFIVILILLLIAGLIAGISIYGHIQFQKAFMRIHEHHERKKEKGRG